MHDIALMEGEAFGFFEFVIAALIVCAVLLLGFLGYCASRPADNPLRQVAGILMMRLAVTFGVGMVDVPLTLTTGPAGGVLDLASLAGLAGYWVHGFWQAARAFMPAKPAAPITPTIVYMQPGQGHDFTVLPPARGQHPSHGSHPNGYPTYQAPPPYAAE